MLTPPRFGSTAGWLCQCSMCLLHSEHYPTEEDARRELEALGWELRADRLTWCVDCSRKAREVPFPTNARGRRRKSR